MTKKQLRSLSQGTGAVCCDFASLESVMASGVDFLQQFFVPRIFSVARRRAECLKAEVLPAQIPLDKFDLTIL